MRSTVPPLRAIGASPRLRLLLAASMLTVACSSSEDDPGALGGGGVSGAAGAAAAGAGGDAGGAGGGGGDGGGAVCPEGALFCDDFEGAAPGAVAAPWRASENGATVGVDSLQAFSGSQAVHVNAAQEGTYHRGYFGLDAAGGAGIFPATEREMYGRAMMYLADLPNADVHWTFIQAEGVSADGTHDAYYRYGGQHQNGAQLMANYETNNNVSTDCWDHSMSLMPVAAWTCVEWRFAGETNEMQFWLNGAELADIHVVDQGEGCIGDALGGQWLAPPAFETLYLGWEHYQQSQNPIDLWVDAVAIGTERMGCPAAP